MYFIVNFFLKLSLKLVIINLRLTGTNLAGWTIKFGLLMDSKINISRDVQYYLRAHIIWPKPRY